MVSQNTQTLVLDQPLQEAETVELEKVTFPRKWALWEGYENPVVKDGPKDGKEEDWKSKLNRVVELQDIITFWQLWNNSTYSKFHEIFNNGDRIRLYFHF